MFQNSQIIVIFLFSFFPRDAFEIRSGKPLENVV